MIPGCQKSLIHITDKKLEVLSDIKSFLWYLYLPCLRNCLLNMYLVPLLLPLVFVMMPDY